MGHWFYAVTTLSERVKKPEKNMEQNNNESRQRTGIIIPGLFLIGFQGIFNTWIQSPLSFSVLQQHGGGIMRQQTERGLGKGTLSWFSARGDIDRRRQLTLAEAKLNGTVGLRSVGARIRRRRINIHVRWRLRFYPDRCLHIRFYDESKHLIASQGHWL